MGYKQDIIDLREEIEDLEHRLSNFEEEIIEENHLKPIIQHNMSRLSASLNENQQQMMALQSESLRNSRLITTLKIENNNIKQTNEKFRIAIENNIKQKQINIENKNKIIRLE